MTKKEEKCIHKVVAQKEGITITAITGSDVTFEEAKSIAKKEVLNGDDYQPFVVLPITTQERWDDKAINFCPRCGSNLKDYQLEQYASFDCYECDTSMDIRINNWID